LSPNEIIQVVGAMTSMPKLWRVITRYCRELGFGAGAYYLLRTNSNDPAIAPLFYGFPPIVRETYLSLDFQRLDVAPRTCIERGMPMTWQDIWTGAVLTAEEQAFFETMRAILPGPGLSFPCYGPMGRNGYIGLSQFADNIDLNPDTLRTLQFILQGAHVRLCELFKPEQDFKPLSSREREILSWVAFGKSNAVIADILAISPGTVDTYMRRIYEKFEVNDRTSAAIKGVGLGLIAA
jgi:DNA-binding CsgD family transcriptional regulator